MKQLPRSTRSKKPAPDAPFEARIAIKPQTAANISALLRARDEAAAVVTAIENRLHDTVRSIYTEHDIAEGKILELTDGPAHELVVVVTKRAPAP